MSQTAEELSSPSIQAPNERSVPQQQQSHDQTAAGGGDAATSAETQKLLSPTNSDSGKPVVPKSPEMRDVPGQSPRRGTGSQQSSLSRTPSDPHSAANFHPINSNQYPPNNEWVSGGNPPPHLQHRYATAVTEQPSPGSIATSSGYRVYGGSGGASRHSYNADERRQFPSGPRPGDMLSKTNLYIKGLPPQTTERDLIAMCQNYGKIASTKAIIDPDTNLCKGYGFVDFENAAEAEAATRGLVAAGVQAQMAKQQEQDLTNLYIANLPDYVDEKYLESMVAPFGTIVSVRILRDLNTGASRGVGFCRMENREACDMAINNLNGQTLPSCTERMLVKFADSSRKRKPRPFLANRMPMNAGDSPMPMRYGIPGSVGGPSHYLPGIGNWHMYSQMPMSMSPHSGSAITTSLPSAVDPAMLATHLSQMQIGGMASYPGPQQGSSFQPTPPAAAMYPQAAAPMAPTYGTYEMSNTPPAHMMTSTQYDDNVGYQTFNQM